MKIKIREPIWKDESVGIRKDLIVDDIEMEIDYKDKGGNKVYPFTYVMKKERALMYPVRVFPKTPPLVMIPIKDFGIKYDTK